MADRIAIMRDGLIEQIASPHAIFSKPGNVFVAGFIGTPQMNLVEATLVDVAGTKRELAFGERRFKITVDRAAAALAEGKSSDIRGQAAGLYAWPELHRSGPFRAPSRSSSRWEPRR